MIDIRAIGLIPIEGFNNADWDTVRDTVVEDFVLYQPLSQEPIVGREALIGFFQSFHDSMPDISHPNVNVLMADEEWAVVLMPIIGTFENEMMGVAPNDEAIVAYVLNFWHIEDGIMAEAFFHFDTLDLLGQMGALPPNPDAPVVERSSEPLEIEIGDTDTDLEANKALVADFTEYLVNTHDFDLIPDYFTEDWVLHNRADPHEDTYTGHAGVMDWGNSFYAMLPDFAVDLENSWMVAEGNLVAMRWIGVGTHTGEVPGIPASGNEIFITGATLHRIEDGKIAETWFVVDTLGMMAQMGMIPNA